MLAASNVSPDLIWAVTKKNSSFLVKRNGHQLSCEPGNLASLNSFKYSGLANPKTVDVRQSGKGAVLVVKTAKNAKSPAKSTQVVALNKNDLKRSYNTVSALVEKNFYRRDLAKTALARVAKLAQASTRASLIKQKKFKVVHGRKSAKRHEFTFNSEEAKKKKVDFAADAAAFGASDAAMDDEPPALTAD